MPEASSRTGATTCWSNHCDKRSKIHDNPLQTSPAFLPLGGSECSHCKERHSNGPGVYGSRTPSNDPPRPPDAERDPEFSPIFLSCSNLGAHRTVTCEVPVPEEDFSGIFRDPLKSSRSCADNTPDAEKGKPAARRGRKTTGL